MIPKIYECLGKDQLRPIFAYAFITKKKTVATDAHVLIAYDTEELFGHEFVAALPDEGIFLNEAALRDMSKKDVHSISFNGKIEVMHLGRSPHKAYFDPETDVGNFPNYESVIPKKEDGEPLSHIGINSKHLLRLQNAMGPDVMGVACYFTGQHKAVIIEPLNSMYESVTAIIMPMQINS